MVVERVRASKYYHDVLVFKIFAANRALVTSAVVTTACDVTICSKKLKPPRTSDDAARKRPQSRTRDASRDFTRLVKL